MNPIKILFWIFTIIVILTFWVDYEKTKREKEWQEIEQQIESSKQIPQQFYTTWFYNFLRSND